MPPRSRKHFGCRSGINAALPGPFLNRSRFNATLRPNRTGGFPRTGFQWVGFSGETIYRGREPSSKLNNLCAANHESTPPPSRGICSGSGFLSLVVYPILLTGLEPYTQRLDTVVSRGEAGIRR